DVDGSVQFGSGLCGNERWPIRVQRRSLYPLLGSTSGQGAVLRPTILRRCRRADGSWAADDPSGWRQQLRCRIAGRPARPRLVIAGMAGDKAQIHVLVVLQAVLRRFDTVGQRTF